MDCWTHIWAYGPRTTPENTTPENHLIEPGHKTKRKTRRSGPSFQESENRIAAQQHRRNGKSIQCPFNVTTYLGHTLFVGSALRLFLYFVIMLTIEAIANRNARMFRIYPNCFFSIAEIAENASSCANQTACLFECVRFGHKNGVSPQRFPQLLQNRQPNVNSL